MIVKQNINTIGRLLRFGIAVLFAIISIWYASWLLAAVSVFVFYEAFAGWCVFYQLIGKNSCHIEKNRK